MENPPLPENWKKKRWTVEEKSQIVRRYLKDHVGLADLAEETGSTPGLILGWAKQALEGIEQTFSREREQQRKVLHREILEKDDRIRRLESVVSELSTENLLLKKSSGDPNRDPCWILLVNLVHIWSLPRLQEVFPVLRTIAAVIYSASEWKVVGLPGLDEVPRTSS